MTPDTSELHWYLVHCKPNQDQRALENLERQHFSCYRPVRPIERLRDGHRISAAEPLFPGYLFIHLDCIQDNWSPIRSTRGVNQIVRFNAYPVPVPDMVIYRIRARLSTNTVAEPYFKAGERVRIAHGPFSGLEAIFVANNGTERVVLLLSLLRQEQKLNFPLEVVRKLG